MRAIILLNGEPYQGEIECEDAHVFCCDGAYEWAKDKVKIDENLGDFDSLSYLPTPPPLQVFPKEKDFTDGELALFRAVEQGYDEIIFYGAGGYREDHFLGNLHLLHYAVEKGVKAMLVTNYARIFAVEGECVLTGVKGKTVSLFPFGKKAHIIKSEGFFYPLPKAFVYGSARGVSNVVTGEIAYFKAKGKVLVLINH